MRGKVLLDRAIDVSYSTAVAGPGDDPGCEPEAFWRGQVNGLCGAGFRGHLSLVTGLHTGYVHLTVELFDAEPPLAGDWEEAVEVSFRQRAKKLWVGGLMSRPYPVALPRGDYRVRYCARGMEEGRRLDTADEDEVVDAYALQFWPGEPAPDRIVRQTGETAAYWHRTHPRRARADRKPATRERRRGGSRRRAPLDRLDADLGSALAEAGDEVCTAVARWAADRAVAVAGLERWPGMAEALAAVRRGEPVAPAELMALLDDPDMVLTTVVLPAAGPDGPPTEMAQAYVALPAVLALADRPPLTAATNALRAAAGAHGEDGYREFFAGLRVAFPVLAGVVRRTGDTCTPPG
ncbi:hypothetical protein Asp14428_13150 [Actinoplanes sp. NBRC 14428]|nr:hypothetical protein Asp14428_13150 [Actinoplanes sp. NBRC 14428]